MTGFVMLFGSGPLQNISPYETVAAVQVLSESIRVQLEEVLEQLAGPDDTFADY